jgi:serine/threonine protein kinase/tetratricopeptide (TPR) repeat protein
MSVTGRYELKQKLGEGGMGEVHLAYDNVMKRECAIKFPTTPGGISDENKKRFTREILILSGVSHPSIVKFFESGEINESLYYTMEYVDGKSINDSKLKPEKIVEYLIQISSALDELHKYGIVHRDIKPENILISNGKAILVDFGIAYLQTDSARLTQTGGLIGTTFYLSPEQIKGRKIDARLDIYSLGVVLYELLTGSHPFVGGDIFALIYKITEEYPKHPRELNPDIPEELEKICLKCLQKSPSRRYNNAKELMEAFENYQNGISSEEENLIESSTGIMPLVGREKIVDKMHKLLDKTMSGGSHSLQLVGSLGLGKSRLLDELKFMALAKKIKYFSCNPELVVDGNPAISNLFSELALQDIALDLEDASVYGGLIREFSPRLADKLNIPKGAVSQSGVIKVEMITDLILKLLGDHTAVFAFEDKLDKFTLSVVKELVKRKQPGKLVVNVSVSKDEDTFEKVITLPPLTKHQIAQLVNKVLGHHISIDDLSIFFRRTGGNPVLAFEVLMLSKKSGEDVTTTLLPENIADILVAKIRNLPKNAWEMLIKISMISNHLTVKDIGAITGYKNDLLYPSITRLISDGLVTEKDVGDEIQFAVSGVIADNVMIETKSGVRQRLSIELAQTLETIDPNKYYFEIGKYYVLGGMFEKGVSYLIGNTSMTNRLAFLDHKLYAVILFKDRIDEIQDINIKALAHLRLSWYHKQKGDMVQFEQNLGLARDIEKNNDINIFTRREILIARFQAIPKGFEDKRTLDISEELLQLTDTEAPLSLQHAAYLVRGIALLSNNNPNEALQWNLRTLEIAERINNSVSYCSSLNVLSINYIELKDFDKAAEYLKKLKKYAEENCDLLSVSAAMNNLAQLYIQMGHIQKAKDQLGEAVRYSSKYRVYHPLSKSLLVLVKTNLSLLELDDARETIKICDDLYKKGKIKTIEVIEELNIFSVYLAILDDDKQTLEKYVKEISDNKDSTVEHGASINKSICKIEHALSKMNLEEVIKICKEFGLSHGKQNDSMQHAKYQILHLLWESFASSYLKKYQRADMMLKRATEIFISTDGLRDNIWVSKVMDIVGLAVEISNVKKVYSSSSRIASKIKKEEMAIELFAKLCEAGVSGENWEYSYFYFWPRLTWMIGDFVLWLAGIDDNHPRLNIIMKEATSIIVNTVDYLKKNNLKAYIKELEKQRRQLAWKLKK